MYIPFLERVFKDIDRPDYNDVAVNYLNHLLNVKKDINISASGDKITAFSSDFESLHFLTKRSPLIFDTTIITLDDLKSKKVFKTRDYRGLLDEHHVYTQNISDLGKFIWDTKDLMLNGHLVFIPRIERTVVGSQNRQDEQEVYRVMPSDTVDSKYNETITLISDAVINDKKVIEVKGNKIPQNNYIKPILSIELPVVDNSNLQTYSNIVCDRYSALENLRLYLKAKMLEIDLSVNDETFFTKIEKLNIEIQKEINLLKNDVEKLNKQNIFRITGSMLSTLIATLVVVDSKLLTDIKTFAGVSGGAFLFFDALRGHIIEKAELRNRPFYFLWLLDKIQK